MAQPSPIGHEPSTPPGAFRGEELDFIAGYATPRTYAKGSVVISEGDDALALYVILSGELKVFTTTHDGRDITLRVLGPGDYFGELTLFDEAPRSASVKANGACRLLVLPKSKLAECLANTPQLYAKLLRDVSAMVRRTTDELKRVASMDVYQRVVKLLLDLATPMGDVLLVTHPLTQQEIASRVCASREMVSRVLQGLVTGGYISRDGGRIAIKKKLPHKW
jgi:CRP/FNR family cyclic AMP-dependent transcriptional regulator